jgi:hypothetical protein
LPNSLDCEYLTSHEIAATGILSKEEAIEMNANGKRSTAPPPTLSIQDLRAELARKIAWFIGSSERQITEVPGLFLVRRTAPTAPCSGTYTPSVIVVAQGSKRVDLGQTSFTYDRSRYLLTSIDLPIVSQVVEASEAKPLSRCDIEIGNVGCPRASQPGRSPRG